MEPRERGRGEGKEEGRRERRIMAELLTTPWMAKGDFLCQRAGMGTAAAPLQSAARSHLEACVAAATSHGIMRADLVTNIHPGRKGRFKNAAGESNSQYRYNGRWSKPETWSPVTADKLWEV